MGYKTFMRLLNIINENHEIYYENQIIYLQKVQDTKQPHK